MTTQLGKYTIQDEIGQGGFAKVYLAQDPVLERDVALKILHPHLLSDPNLVRRFHEDARAAAKLEQAHIITVYDYGEAEGRLFLALQYCPGGTLADRLKTGRLMFAEALDILVQISAALDYAHSQGFIHRDVKPSNILFTAAGEAVLADFGLVKTMESSLVGSMTGDVVGTPNYIPPEVWDSEPASPATDVYALGCVFYEMLTGEALFKRETLSGVMRAHFQPRRFPATWPASVPEGIENVLEKALAQDPTQRYATAVQFQSALVALKRSIGDPPPGKKPYTLWVATLIFLLGSAALALGAWRVFGPDANAVQDAGSPVAMSAGPGQTEISPVNGRELISVHNVDKLEELNGWSTGSLWDLAFTTDDSTLVVAARAEIKIYDPNTVVELSAFNTRVTVHSVTLSPDGETVATGDTGGRVQLWRRQDGLELRTMEGHTSAVNDILYTPDGEYLISGSSDKTIRVWELHSRTLAQTFAGHTRRINTLAITPDGKLLASGADDGSVRLWQMPTGKVLRILGEDGSRVKAVGFSANGQLVAAGLDDASIRVWHVDDGSLFCTLSGHDDDILSLASNSWGDLLASGSADGTVRLWRMSDGSALQVFNVSDRSIGSVAFSPDGSLLVSGTSNGAVQIWGIADE